MTRLAGAHVHVERTGGWATTLTAYRQGYAYEVEVPSVALVGSRGGEILDVCLDALDNLVRQREDRIESRGICRPDIDLDIP